jgi:prolyl 4-hydroxylase
MLTQKFIAFCLVTLLSSARAGFWTENAEGEVDNAQPKQPDEAVEYGVDVSFPMHYAAVSTNYAWLPHNIDHSLQSPREYEDMPIQPLGDRQIFYKKFLDSCKTHFGSRGSRCTQNEMDRISMSLRQPQSMQNYTELGFKSK